MSRKSSFIDLMKRILDIIPHSDSCLRNNQWDRSRGDNRKLCRCDWAVISKDLKYWASIGEREEVALPDVGQCSYCSERLYVLPYDDIIEPHTYVNYHKEIEPCPGQGKPKKQ